MSTMESSEEQLVNTHYRIGVDQKEALRRLSFEERVPESQLVREAIDLRLKRKRKK